MDRFIAATTLLSSLYNLKSNMDRFIEIRTTVCVLFFEHLKSNMDRFIGLRF